MKDEKIITLYGENGKNIDFYLDAEIEYENEMYQVLRPTKENLELNQDEALVFMVEEINGENNYTLITDDEILKEIEKIYMNN